MPKIHIVGKGVIIVNRYARQLCAWCGECLVDEDATLVAVPEGTPARNPFWQENALLEVGEGYATIVQSAPWWLSKPARVTCVRDELWPLVSAVVTPLRLVPKPGADERLEQQTRCDHKFVDSNHCLKCGWEPPPRGRSA